jgi:hypothetical protein
MSKPNDEMPMTDHELDRLLQSAPAPTPPLGAKGRLMARLAEPAPGRVAPRIPVQHKMQRFWYAGIPLAASLVLGIYLGASGVGQTVIPGTTTEILVGALSGDVSTGMDEAEILAEESQS